MKKDRLTYNLGESILDSIGNQLDEAQAAGEWLVHAVGADGKEIEADIKTEWNGKPPRNVTALVYDGPDHRIHRYYTFEVIIKLRDVREEKEAE